MEPGRIARKGIESSERLGRHLARRLVLTERLLNATSGRRRKSVATAAATASSSPVISWIASTFSSSVTGVSGVQPTTLFAASPDHRNSPVRSFHADS
ncbi:hypothetical protein DT019_32595 [Streptomyces sp. SDr-06]|nr:hypothetical protein [Streptomyces sp. SDr-06]RCH64462.1 hypothetical protein DT019_32595 [Streptomyces sp. SDr-06]